MRRIGPALIVVSLIAGCGGGEPAPESTPVTVEPRTPESSVKERGPVVLTVTVDDDDLRVGDTFDLVIDVRAEPRVDVELPVLEDEIGGFLIDSAETPRDVPDPDGTRRTTHRYSLFTFDPGSHEIPPIAITFRDGNRADSLPQELSSDALLVEVVTALEPDADPTAIRALRDAVAIPVPTDWRRIGLITAAAAAVVVLAAVMIVLLRRRAAARAAAPPPPVPAHVWAREALRELEKDGLLDRGELHGFYVRLSDIVRGYLERRFALHAPEQTTDEFLRATERSRTLNENHRALLADFLRAADMVKFARFAPTPDEGQTALSKAADFVDETALLGSGVS